MLQLSFALVRSHFVWNLPLDLSAMGDPTRSKAPDGIALRIIGTHKPPHHYKVAIEGKKNVMEKE